MKTEKEAASDIINTIGAWALALIGYVGLWVVRPEWAAGVTVFALILLML